MQAMNSSENCIGVRPNVVCVITVPVASLAPARICAPVKPMYPRPEITAATRATLLP